MRGDVLVAMPAECLAVLSCSGLKFPRLLVCVVCENRVLNLLVQMVFNGCVRFCWCFKAALTFEAGRA